MQFKFDSTLKVGHAKIVLENLEAPSVKVETFEGNEGKCAQCMQHIKNGEQIIAVQDIEFKGGAITLDQQLQMVHIKSIAGLACAEDYLSRILSKHTPPDVTSEGSTDAQVVAKDSAKDA